MRTEQYNKVVNYIMHHQDEMYCYTYLQVQDQDRAMQIVKDVVALALLHYREIYKAQSMQQWFVQEIGKRNS